MSLADSPEREWTNTQGKNITAGLRAVSETEVLLVMKNGATARVRCSDLSEADNEFLDQWRLAREKMKSQFTLKIVSFRRVASYNMGDGKKRDQWRVTFQLLPSEDQSGSNQCDLTKLALYFEKDKGSPSLESAPATIFSDRNGKTEDHTNRYAETQDGRPFNFSVSYSVPDRAIPAFFRYEGDPEIVVLPKGGSVSVPNISFDVK